MIHVLMFANDFPQIAYITADEVKLLETFGAKKCLFHDRWNGVNVIVTQIEKGQFVKLNKLKRFWVRCWFFLLLIYDRSSHRTFKKRQFLESSQKVAVLVVSDKVFYSCRADRITWKIERFEYLHLGGLSDKKAFVRSNATIDEWQIYKILAFRHLYEVPHFEIKVLNINPVKLI